MAKIINVVFKGDNGQGLPAHRDLTIGKTYTAWHADKGQTDPHGFKVAFDDELWISEDDAGDTTVTRIADWFDVV